MTPKTTVRSIAYTAGMGVTLAALALAIHSAAPSSATQAAAAQPPAQVNFVVVPDSLQGSDKHTHDSIIPANVTLRAGQPVTLTFYNLDAAPHTFTSQALGLNVVIAAAKAQGQEAVTNFTFTPKKAGTYQWRCLLPCDNGGANAWAMTHNGYMAGIIVVR